MKTTNKILALALMAVAMVFASCSKDDNDAVGPTQQEIETNIVGKWKTIATDGVTVLTNDREVVTYNSNKYGFESMSKYIDETGEYIWVNNEPHTWSVEKNMITRKRVSIGVSVFMSVNEIDDHHISYFVTKAIDPQGSEHKPNSRSIARKVTADYSQDIIGLWEGVDMTGYETYGDAHHHIEYRADGTYTYYSWEESTQTWKPLEDVFDEWNVDGDWLATRWQNNGSDVMNYEWWDIDYIKKEGDDIIMKWSALREKEGGERFTTTFTWKKVK